MSSFDVIRGDVALEVTGLGQAKLGLEELRRQFRESTGQMSTEALRAAVAQEKLDRAIARHGPASTQAKAAEVSFRRELAASTGQLSRHSTALRSEERDLGRFSRGAIAGSGALRGLGRSLAFASAGFLGGAGIVYALRSTVAAAIRSQAVLSQTEVAVKRSGNSWAEYGDRIKQAALAQSNASGFDDERLLQTFALLIRRTGDVNEALRLNALAADVARGRNISLEQAAQLVVKASLGQAGALRRVGIDAKKGADAQQLLYLLQQKYAGAAEAYGRTAAGAQERFRVAIENTQETIGTALLPTITTYLNRASDWLGNARNQERIQRDVNTVVRDGTEVVHGLEEGLHGLQTVLEPTIKAMGGLKDATELLLALFVVRKVTAFATALGLIGPAAVTAGAGVATAEGEIAAGGAAAGIAAGKVGLLKSGLLGLGRLGPIAIAVSLDIATNYLPQGNTKNPFSGIPILGNVTGFGEYLGEAIAGGGGQPQPTAAERAAFIRRSQRSIIAAGGQIPAFGNPLALAGGRGPTATSTTTPPPAPPLGRGASISLALARAQATGNQQAILAALRDQIAYTQKYIAIQEGLLKTDGKHRAQHAKILEGLYATVESAQGQIDQIEQDAAAKAAEAARKREAARRKREQDAKRREAAQARADRAQASANVKFATERVRLINQDAAAQVKAIDAVGDALVKARKAREAAAAKTAQTRDELEQQLLDNALARAGLITDPKAQLAAEKKAEQKIIDYWRRKAAATTGLAHAQAVGQMIAAQAAKKALQPTGAGGAAFSLSDLRAGATSDFATYGSNLGTILSPQDALGGLGGAILFELRKGNTEHRRTAIATTSLNRDRPTPISHARVVVGML